jgi:hypothetical protein
MRDPMARSRRLTDGTRWRTFMRLLRLDDLRAYYTNAGAPEPPARLSTRDRFGRPVKAVLKR